MTKRIVAVTGEYQNQQGETKAEFTNVGIIGVSSSGKEYMLLDPLYSAAGVLAKQNALAFKRGEPIKDMVMCSVFENDNNQGQQGQQGQQQGYGNQGQQQGYQNQGYQR
jgi:hypothetical protein